MPIRDNSEYKYRDSSTAIRPNETDFLIIIILIQIMRDIDFVKQRLEHLKFPQLEISFHLVMDKKEQ